MLIEQLMFRTDINKEVWVVGIKIMHSDMLKRFHFLKHHLVGNRVSRFWVCVNHQYLRYIGR